MIPSHWACPKYPYMDYILPSCTLQSFVHWSHLSSDHLTMLLGLQVRLNLLPALLEEAYAHMHGCLCASVLERKLFLQPFHRDVRVTSKVVGAMRSTFAYCKQVSGWGLGAGVEGNKEKNSNVAPL
jgi:hypothetical protein